jgi:hypothetical protein
MTHLLDIPDEILCKILEYLSSFHVIYSFNNLNIRLNRLLMPFKQQIDLTFLSYEQFIYYMNILLPMINTDESLYVIKLGNERTPGQIELFNKLIEKKIHRDNFNHIDKVLLQSPRLDELSDFVKNFLLSLSKLVTLSIKIDFIRDEDFQTLTQLIVHSILSISTLVKLSIEMPSGLVLSRLSNTIMLDSLIDVTLNLSLVTDLLILIQRIPNVENLSIRICWWTSGDRTLVKMLDKMRSDNNPTSFLNNLKKFHLTVDSIMTFQFEHLEQVLHRIMNNQTTYSFTFILRSCLNHNNGLTTQLIDGQQWENLLSLYKSLNEFNLFIRMSDSPQTEEQEYNINSFKRKYFLEKKWFFSYFKYSSRNILMFYTIPYKNKELFDISTDNLEIFHKFPMNYASNILIDQTNTKNYQFDQSIIHLILNQFPSLKQLSLIHVDINPSLTNPVNIPSLHTLKIEKCRNIDVSKLLRLFPLINTLVLSYYTIYNGNQSFE